MYLAGMSCGDGERKVREVKGERAGGAEHGALRELPCRACWRTPPGVCQAALMGGAGLAVPSSHPMRSARPPSPAAVPLQLIKATHLEGGQEVADVVAVLVVLLAKPGA